MFCPYLGEDLPDADFSLEHIVPLSVGGCDAFSIRVSKKANSDCGDEVDALLTNNFFIAAERIALGLTGQSGRLPKYKMRGTIDIEGRVVDASCAVTAIGAEVRIPPEVTRFVDADGGEKVTIACELSDLDRILKDINRKQADRGKPLVDYKEFVATARISSGDYPVDVAESFDVRSFERPFIKMALGAAHFALGELYTRTGEASQIRRALWESNADVRDALGLRGKVWPNIGGLERIVKEFGSPHTHVVIFTNTDVLAVAIILFGMYVGTLRLSDDSGRYASTVGNGLVYVLDVQKRQMKATTPLQFLATKQP